MARVNLHVLDPIGPQDGDLVVLGHSLGTSAAIWDHVLPSMADRFRIVRWELPGHGAAAPASGSYRVGEVTEALLTELDRRRLGVFHYVGVSIGGCVGLDLALRSPERLSTLTVVSSGARVDDPALMRGRAVTARHEGLEGFAGAFRERWFAPSTPPAIAERVLDLLRQTDAESYAVAAEALAEFDVVDRLSHIATPLLAVGGADDRSVPFATSRDLASRVQRGTAVSIPAAAHSLVAEQPHAFARALLSFLDDPNERRR